MTARGDARRARMGPRLAAAAREEGLNAPAPSRALLAELAVLLRKFPTRNKRTEPPAAAPSSDVA
jgi:hypothetical protein